MKKCILFILVLSIILHGAPALAHFGVIIPSSSTVLSPKESTITLDIAFAHPFAAKGMKMLQPLEAFAFANGRKTPLALADQTWLGEGAFRSEYRIPVPGVYQFAVVPQPYYEESENTYIIHFTKTVVGAFGHEDGWNEPLGLPMEIIPLTRPFANYAGNSFTGQALRQGKPLANTTVEVEFLNKDRKYIEPNAYFETQTLLTDANGVFTFSIPWAGWWGFAVLAQGDEPMLHEGKEAEVELGAVIWLQFANPELSSPGK